MCPNLVQIKMAPRVGQHRAHGRTQSDTICHCTQNFKKFKMKNPARAHFGVSMLMTISIRLVVWFLFIFNNLRHLQKGGHPFTSQTSKTCRSAWTQKRPDANPIFQHTLFSVIIMFRCRNDVTRAEHLHPVARVPYFITNLKRHTSQWRAHYKVWLNTCFFINSNFFISYPRWTCFTIRRASAHSQTNLPSKCNGTGRISNIQCELNAQKWGTGQLWRRIGQD